jgi:hypothetical protein
MTPDENALQRQMDDLVQGIIQKVSADVEVTPGADAAFERWAEAFSAYSPETLSLFDQLRPFIRCT